MIFPILNDGYVEILEDGFYGRYSDGSGGYYSTNEKENYVPSQYLNPTFIPVKKGERFKVTGIRINNPDFGLSIKLVTEIGRFSEHDYNPNPKYGKPSIQPNKIVYNKSFMYISYLMAWPLFPFILLLSPLYIADTLFGT